MFLINPAMEHIDAGTAALSAVLGYAVVFFGLILLMAVIVALGKAMVAKAKKAAVQEAPAAPAAEKDTTLAPGSAGEMKIYDVPDRDAAMIMAIVADKMGKPLNELRFKSIKEVK